MESFEINGVTLVCPEAQLTEKIRSKLASGEYEGSEARAVKMRVKAGHRVLELGAGLGYIGALAAQIVGASHVTSVEANPDMIGAITANYARNGAGGIDLRHGAAVGQDYEGDTLAFARAKQFWASRIAGAGDTGAGVVEVPALRIDALLGEVKPNFVIMDIEGAEQYLFAAKWPRFVKHVVIELHPKQYESGKVIKHMVDVLSRSGLTYDPVASRGTLLALRRV
ncbi:FkbM family methyltransferase [Lentibacter sp. XHP0401]|uniref:FkbM family methyltransferase n=1 Tax=Lentibacter sp. XHP0401 TaxID=2984334 RepID=UPI0021E92AFC|nr:FkbM family methyltransferase [Lentibacter sp. XHP0401]MCV2894524.1 FkbM family methyltransferase [Lentibacter sp. XHP0401]